jgi:hypothetical protein
MSINNLSDNIDLRNDCMSVSAVKKRRRKKKRNKKIYKKEWSK